MRGLLTYVRIALMLVLGIDPGTATTGYGLIKINLDGQPVLVDHGLIETDKNGHPGTRLVEIYNRVEDLLRDYKPDVVATEKIFFFVNAKTVIRVSQAQGVLLLVAAHRGVPVVEYAPGQIKLVVGGSGRADKRMMKEAVRNLFGLEAQSKKKTHFDNVADAIAVAVCHARLAVS